VSKKVGLDCILYRCATVLSEENPQESASWVEVDVRDVTMGGETGKADVTTRGNNGFRASRMTLKDSALEITGIWDRANAGLVALLNAWLNRTEIALAAMDGDIDETGSQGLVGNFQVTKFSRAEQLEQGVEVQITVDGSSEIDYYTVAGS
jgi:hypothetical protein